MSKIQFEIEYLVHSSALILYNCISNPSSLEEWFADSVNQKGDQFTFKWEDEERHAKLLSAKKNQFVCWQWDEKEFDNTFFEMRIKVDEMTNEIALIITDFCDEGDEEDARMLWDLAIDDLHRVIGR
ncbi:MAG: START-like domain-containing protein [Sediminibacterium sp.]